jgi:hypothetical protein
MRIRVVVLVAAAALITYSCSTTDTDGATDTDTELPVAAWTRQESSRDPLGVTDEVPATGALPDGTYLGTLVEDPTRSGPPVFLLEQGWFAEACYEHFAEEIAAGEPVCMNDIEIVPGPGPTVALAAKARVVVTPEVYDTTKYVVDADILAEIARGIRPTDAPPEWIWVPFPFILEVRGGEAVAVEQIWLP